MAVVLPEISEGRSEVVEDCGGAELKFVTVVFEVFPLVGGGEINLGGDVPQHLLAIFVEVALLSAVFSSTETTSAEEDEVVDERAAERLGVISDCGDCSELLVAVPGLLLPPLPLPLSLPSICWRR